MLEPRRDEATLREREPAEDPVNLLAEGAKAYWRMWGPLGEPMIRSIDAWTDMQRGYLAWLPHAPEAEGLAAEPDFFLRFFYLEFGTARPFATRQ